MVGRDHVRVAVVAGLDAAFDLGRRHDFGDQCLGGVLAGRPRIRVVAARVEVHRCVPGLGPGMDRQVRLLDHDDAGHALGLKPMKGPLDDRSVRLFCSLDHDVGNRVDVGEHLRVTTRQLANDVRTKCFQLPSILLGYRLGNPTSRRVVERVPYTVSLATFQRTLAGRASLCTRTSRCDGALGAPPPPSNRKTPAIHRGPESPAPIIPPHPPAVNSLPANISKAAEGSRAT